MDSYNSSVVIVDLDAGEGESGHFCNYPDTFEYNSISYAPVPAMKFVPAALTGDFSAGDYKLENVDISVPVVSGIANNLPYSKVAVTIRELLYDGDGVLVSEQYLFRGFVYQSNYKVGKGLVTIIIRDNKYYTDTVAGVPCTELCANHFGDQLCLASVHSETHTIDSVSGTELTLAGDLTDTTPFLFNKGYIAVGAQRIDIKYHESGRTFQMVRDVPASWAKTICEVYAGCDKQLATCKDIHDNELQFRGMGIAMVDYNVLYETS